MEKKLKFDICNENTWKFATEQPFIWHDDSFYDLDNIEKKYSELDFVDFIGQMLNIVESHSSLEKMNDFGRSKIISQMLDQIQERKIATNDICYNIAMRLNNNIKEEILFNIYDNSTWNYANSKQFFWKGNPIFFSNNKDIVSEKNIVDFIMNIFNNNSMVSISQIESYGKNKIIDLIIEEFIKKTDEEQILQKVYLTVRHGFDSSLMNTVYPVKTSEELVQKNIQDKSNPGLFLFLTIISIGISCYFFYNALKMLNTGLVFNSEKIIQTFIISCVPLIIGLIFAGLYNKEKKKKQYYEVCKSMEYWIGHTSDDLIMAWGTPTKTTKLPQDKTTSILEYKDSIRNYVGYSTRSYRKGTSFGIHTGQSKTTKYIKTFYVKNGIVFDYKYTIQ